MLKDSTGSFGEHKHRDITLHVHEDANGFKVTLADTGTDTMAGGRLKRFQHYVDSETFMVTNGDDVSDVTVREFLAFHRRHGTLATVTAICVPPR